MMTKKLFILIVAFLLILPFAFAEVNYTESGDLDNFYIRGTGNFNSQLTQAEIIVNPAIVSNTKKTPLVNDLDGDGILEIIVLSGSQIILFQNKTLDSLVQLALDAPTNEKFSNMITFDIDGDNLNEIILVGEKRGLLHIVEWDGATLSETTINASASINHTLDENSVSASGQFIIGCESTNRCLMAYGNNQVTGSETNVFASFFNSTDVANEIQLTANTDVEDTFCSSKIRHMAKSDYDDDGSTEFIFTFNQPTDTGADDEVTIFWVDVTSTNIVVEEIETQTSEVGRILRLVSFGTGHCDDSNGDWDFELAGGFGGTSPEKFFTSPLVYNADPNSAGLETIIAVMTDPNEFIMIMYDSTGNEIREFPLIAESEGQLLGNVFRAEVFDDSSSETDFCILGQLTSPSEQISITCGSLTDTSGFGLFNLQTIEFRSNTTFGVPFNISDGFDFHGILIHSVEYDQTNSESEVITSYGVLELDTDSGLDCSIGNNCELNLLFRNPRTNGTVITTDLENVDREDLIIMTTRNLFYIDDGFENQNVNPFCGEPTSVSGTCSAYEINPCLDSTWKINTSVTITVTPKDPEQDTVEVSATIYDGDFNEQSEAINVSSGTETPFSFIANKTVGSGVITLTITDIIENPQDTRTLTKGFSVAPTGLEFNDCKTTVTSGVLDEDEDEIVEEATISLDATDDSITTGVGTLSGISGLAGTTIWLILMLAFSLGIWFQMTERGLSGSSALGTIAISNVLFILIATRLGIFSTALVIIITVIGVVIAGVFLGRFLTGQRTELT